MLPLCPPSHLLFFPCFVYLNLFCFYLLPPHPPSHLFFLFCMYIDSICLVVLCVNLFIAGFGTRFDFVVLYTLACLLDRSLYNYFHLYFLPTFFPSVFFFVFVPFSSFLFWFVVFPFHLFVFIHSLFVVTFLLPLVLFLSLFFLFFLFWRFVSVIWFCCNMQISLWCCVSYSRKDRLICCRLIRPLVLICFRLCIYLCFYLFLVCYSACLFLTSCCLFVCFLLCFLIPVTALSSYVITLLVLPLVRLSVLLVLTLFLAFRLFVCWYVWLAFRF